MKNLLLLAALTTASISANNAETSHAADPIHVSHDLEQKQDVVLTTELDEIVAPAEDVTKEINDATLEKVGSLSTCSSEEIKPILEALWATATADTKAAFSEILQNHTMVVAMFHDHFKKEVSEERVKEIAAIVHAMHEADVAAAASHHDGALDK